MCPAEVKGRLKALSVAKFDALESADRLAWMVGSYCLTNPKRYPKKPAIVKRKEELKVMTDDEMKGAMRALMKRQGESNADNA